jgi:hypothetical protein
MLARPSPPPHTLALPHRALPPRLRRAIAVAPPGSLERHQRRVAVLETCRFMMEGVCAADCTTHQGCASPYPFETALRLLEIEEEAVGACAGGLSPCPSAVSQG